MPSLHFHVLENFCCSTSSTALDIFFFSFYFCICWMATPVINGWNFIMVIFCISLMAFHIYWSFVYPQNEVKWLSHVQLFATRWTVAYQAPPSLGFSRQEYWSGLPFPSTGSSQPRVRTQVSHTADRCFTLWATREGPKRFLMQKDICKSNKWAGKKSGYYLKAGNCPCLSTAKPQHCFHLCCWYLKMLGSTVP